MEVHHHPDVHQKRKKFKEYFLEFLMIFLAVTLGFFAENIREKIVSNERELNYMRSIVEDLKRDTAELRYVFFKQNFLINEIDSALNIPLATLRNVRVQDNFFRYYLYFYSLLSTFNPHDNTLSQLKNAGGFSVLHRSDVLDSIGIRSALPKPYCQRQLLVQSILRQSCRCWFAGNKMSFFYYFARCPEIRSN